MKLQTKKRTVSILLAMQNISFVLGFFMFLDKVYKNRVLVSFHCL